MLAAFEPVPHFGLGLVAKIDMAEINERYLRAGAIAALISLAAVLGAALLFLRVGEPMIRRLRESESRYRELFDRTITTKRCADGGGVPGSSPPPSSPR